MKKDKILELSQQFLLGTQAVHKAITTIQTVKQPMLARADQLQDVVEVLEAGLACMEELKEVVQEEVESLLSLDHEQEAIKEMIFEEFQITMTPSSDLN